MNLKPEQCVRRLAFFGSFVKQDLSSITSFLLTLERYLVIVYSLSPEVRLYRRMAFVCLIFTWFLALCLAIYAVYYNFYRLNLFCVPISLHLGINPFVFELTVAIIALTCYSVSFIFYVSPHLRGSKARRTKCWSSKRNLNLPRG